MRNVAIFGNSSFEKTLTYDQQVKMLKSRLLKRNFEMYKNSELSIVDESAYLNSKKGTKLSDEVNFTSDNVNNELKKTEKQNLYYIPYDKYFISWIESVQKNVAHDTYGIIKI